MKFQPILIFGVRKTLPIKKEIRPKKLEYTEEEWEILKDLFDGYEEGEEFDLE